MVLLLSSWRDGDPLTGDNRDWSGLARTRKRPRSLIWIRRKNSPGSESEWSLWLAAAKRAAKLGDGFPELHLSKSGKRRILTGILPPGEWKPLFRLRRKRGPLDLASALEIACQTAELVAQAEERGITSDKPLNRELLFDSKEGALLLCGHWRLFHQDEHSNAPERLLRLLRFLSGRGPTMEALEERYQAHIAAGKIVDAHSAYKSLRQELGTMLGEQPKNSRDWFRRERKGWRKGIILLAALGTLLGGGALGWILIQEHGRPLPNVVGAEGEKAKDKLLKAGWRVRIVYKRSEVVPGKVITQKPAAHQTLAAGQTVLLTVSRAKRMGRVPRLAGLDLNNARDELWAAGFNWKPVSRRGGRVGVVIDSDPKPGTSLPQGTVVVVYYGAP